VTAALRYGEASDTWSANPLACAAVLATLDEFESRDVLGHAASLTPAIFDGLDRLKQTGLVSKVRGEGFVFGIECAPCGGRSDKQVAEEIVRTCYLGHGSEGIHLLGALAGNVIRVSPPLTITADELRDSLDLFFDLVSGLADRLRSGERVAVSVG
jgi:4-aminobutyrate aminotransferase-like enzyme